MNIFDTLRLAANPEKAVPMSAYMRDQFHFLGISTPQRRKICRDFLKSLGKKVIDWDFIFECWRQPEREFQYVAKDYISGVASVLQPSDLSVKAP